MEWLASFRQIRFAILQLGSGVAGSGQQTENAEDLPPRPKALRSNNLRADIQTEVDRFIDVAGARIDLSEGLVRSPEGATTELRRQSAHVLRVLAAHRGATISKDDIFAVVWGDVSVTEDSLVQCVRDIRTALGGASGAIRTARGRGYRLEIDGGGASALRAPRLSAWFAAALLALAVPILIWSVWDRDPAPAGMGAPVVAVLPFDAIAGGARWDALSRGLTEDLTADLAQNDWLFVLGSASSRRYADTAPAQIAAALGADFIVTGTLQAEGAHVRVVAALLDAESGRQVWSKRWDGPEADLLLLQRQASEALVGELASNWSGPIAEAVRAKARGRGTLDLAAYEAYLLGAERVHRFTRDDLAAGADLLRRAVRIDPDFGDAWAKLSIALSNMAWPELPKAEQARILAESDAAALEGYRVAPDSPLAVGQAADVVARTDLAGATRMARRTVALAPNDADILAFAGLKGVRIPELAHEAAGWLERAYRLNPEQPIWYEIHYAMVLVALGRYQEAYQAYATPSDFVDVRAGRTAALALAGDVEGARRELSGLMRSEPDFTVEWWIKIWSMHPSIAETFARGLRLAGAPEAARVGAE